MDLLKVGREAGKKGSRTPIYWNPQAVQAFEELKVALTEGLELFQMDVGLPFIMHTDASDFTIGGVLKHDREGQIVPVAFYGRKLGGSQ